MSRYQCVCIVRPQYNQKRVFHPLPFFGWQVSPHFLTERKAYGFNSGLLNEQVLTEFCGYWLGKNEKLTQVEWEHKLANNLVKLTNNPVLSTCTARKSNVPDNNTTDWLTPELAEEIGL